MAEFRSKILRNVLIAGIVFVFVISISLYANIGSFPSTPSVSKSTTFTSTSTSSRFVNSTTSQSYNSTTSQTYNSTCTVLAPAIGVVIQVVENNYTQSGTYSIPVSGISISGQDIGYCNGQKQVIILNKMMTNSTGWATLLDGGFGTYYLNVDNFTLSIPTQAESITEVNFNLSSGNVTTHFIYTL